MQTLTHVALSNAVIATVLALIAFLIGRTTRRPALAHGLWLLVLLKLFTPPLLSIPVDLPRSDVAPLAEPVRTEAATPDAPSAVDETIEVDNDLRELKDERPDAVVALPAQEPIESSLDASAAHSPATIHEPPVATATPETPWRRTLLLTWLAGTVGWLLLAGSRIVRFQRLLRYSRAAPDWLQCEVKALAGQLGLKRIPRTHVVPGRLSPIVWAIGPARLLIPGELLPKLTAEQRKTLLLHELAHLYRRDHWVRLLEMLSMAAFWWHPIVWWARRELRELEEQCCDAWVVGTLPGTGRSYATALIECLDFLSDARSSLPVAASGIGHARPLKRRLTMILSRTKPQRLTWLSGLTLLTLGALLLPVLPTLADEKEEEKRTVRSYRAFVQADKAQAARLKEAAAVVQDLKFQVEKQRDQLHVTEKRLREAMERLESLSKGNNRRTGVIKGDRIIIIREGEKEEIVDLKTVSPADLKHLDADLKRLDRDFHLDPKGTGGTSQKRIDAMEEQLRNLMREMQELRRQLNGDDAKSGKPRTGKEKADPEAAFLKKIEAERLRALNAEERAVAERQRALEYLRALEAAKQKADAQRAEAEAQRKKAEEALKRAIEEKNRNEKESKR